MRPTSIRAVSKNLFRLAARGFLLLVLLGSSPILLQAQQAGPWSPQARIPEYEDLTETPPFLIADENMTVHVFNSQALELNRNNSPRAVFYRQWTPDKGWTDPIDVILNPDSNSLDLLDVYLDEQGMVHLLIQMGTKGLYYTKADLALAGRAASWSRPVLLDEQAAAMTTGVPFVAAINGDGGDEIVVLYSGLRDGNGMYALHSTNQGDTWGAPTTIYLTGDEEILPVAPKLAMGGSGSMHAVWSSFNEDGSGGPGYYAQLDVENGRWQSLIELDTPGIRTPNAIEYGDDIIVTYYHHNENKNWWRKSSDGGQTWSQPSLIAPLHRGTNGFTSFAIDSNNDLHLFFGQRIDDNNHGMWHTLWTGNGWAEISPVVRGAQVRDREGGQGFDPHSARSVIINGNHLLVTWVTDGFAGLNGAWYSFTTLAAPELPRLPLVSPTPIIANDDPATDFVIAPEALIPTRHTLADEQQALDSAITHPSNPLLISLLPVVALIAGVVVVWQLRRYR
jgi:hypothetical protein